jgi:hypothetical protein
LYLRGRRTNITSTWTLKYQINLSKIQTRSQGCNTSEKERKKQGEMVQEGGKEEERTDEEEKKEGREGGGRKEGNFLFSFFYFCLALFYAAEG